MKTLPRDRPELPPSYGGESSRLPLEIMEYIIDYALERENSDKIILLQLLRVSKAWQIAALHKLYQTVDLSHLGEDAVSIDRLLKVCMAFNRLPELQTMTKKLVLRLTGRGRSDRKYLEIIRLCRTTRHLVLKGNIPTNPSVLTDALLGTNLRSLRLKLWNNDDVYMFKSDLALIGFLQNLPQIEEVTCGRASFPPKGLNNKNSKPLGPISCAAVAHMCLPLTKLNLYDAGRLSREALETLGSLSLPYLQSFSLSYNGSENEDITLIQCLELWAPTLEELAVKKFYPFDTSQRTRFTEVLNQMTRLKSLRVGEAAVFSQDPPHIQIPFLSTLTCGDSLRDRDVIELATKLERKSEGSGGQRMAYAYLPGLASLNIYTAVPSRRLDKACLVSICHARSISLIVWVCNYRSDESGNAKPYWVPHYCSI